MKTNSSVTECSVAICWGVALLCLGFSCKDDEPCDPGQEERSAGACFPIPMEGASGAAGAAGTQCLQHSWLHSSPDRGAAMWPRRNSPH